MGRLARDREALALGGLARDRKGMGGGEMGWGVGPARDGEGG